MASAASGTPEPRPRAFVLPTAALAALFRGPIGDRHGLEVGGHQRQAARRHCMERATSARTVCRNTASGYCLCSHSANSWSSPEFQRIIHVVHGENAASKTKTGGMLEQPRRHGRRKSTPCDPGLPNRDKCVCVCARACACARVRVCVVASCVVRKVICWLNILFLSCFFFFSFCFFLIFSHSIFSSLSCCFIFFYVFFFFFFLSPVPFLFFASFFWSPVPKNEKTIKTWKRNEKLKKK